MEAPLSQRIVKVTSRTSVDVKPRIQGTDVTVYEVLQHLADGHSVAQIAECIFPQLCELDVRACILYAAVQSDKYYQIAKLL